MPRLNDLTRELLGPHYDEVSTFLRNNSGRLVAADMAGPSDAIRALRNPELDPTETKILRGRTRAVREMLDQPGISASGYYNTMINFYSTPAGRALGQRLDQWAANPNVTEDEIRAMTKKVYNGARGGMTPAELADINRTMDLQDNAPGTQTVQPAAAASTAPPAAPVRPPAPPRGRSPVNYAAELEREYTAFQGKGMDFTTADEKAYVARLVRRIRSNGEVTEEEYNIARNTMHRLDDRGEQPLETVAPPAPSRRESAAPAAPTSPPDAPPAEPAEPAAPPRYRLPERFDPNDPRDYNIMIAELGSKMSRLMPEGMAEGNDAAAFIEQLNSPAFRARFIEQYNNDPVFRQRFQQLFNNVDGIAQAQDGPMGSLMGFLGGGADGLRGRLQGRAREIIADPNRLLDANYLETLRQETNDAAHPGASMFQGFARMFGIDGPADMNNFFQGIMDFFRRLFSGEGLASLGLSGAGNAGGNLFASLGNLFGGNAGAGAGAGTGAPPPPTPQLADANPTGQQQRAPNGGTPAPAIGGTSPPAAPINT